ncbi:MAG: ElyC/SanA/YdcF family protein [bacterium]|nr:ElyC/SanA/YdcF family protein [bacterium]
MEKVPQKSESPAKKMEAVFQHKKPDALVVLSMDIVEAPAREGGYKSGSYADVDVRGLTSGGKGDVIAAAEAAKYFPDAMVVTDTRDRDESRGRPTHARIYAEEIERLGVPKERILLEEISTSTITELVELIKLSAVRNWKHVAVIVNDFHRARTEEMLARLPSLADPNDRDFTDALRQFKARGGEIACVTAEEILLIRDPRYARLLDKVRNTEVYKARVRVEEQGIRDLREGTYRKKDRT